MSELIHFKMQLPENNELEKDIIACMASNDKACEIAIDVLSGEEFFNHHLREYFRDAQRQFAERGNFNIALSQDQMNMTHELVIRNTHPACIEELCKHLIDLYKRRAIVNLSYKLASGAVEGDAVEVANVVTQSIGQILDKSNNSLRRPVANIGDIAKEIYADIKTNGPRDTWGIDTGFCGSDFDRLTGGIQNSQLWVVTGRTGVGKSVFCLSLLLAFAQKHSESHPLIISTEMYDEPIARRLLAYAAQVDVQSLLHRRIKEDEEKRLKATIESNALSNIACAYRPGASFADVRFICNMHKRMHGLPLLVIDLAEGISVGGAADEYHKLTSICRFLNQLKGELDTCILAVVQQKGTSYDRPDDDNDLGILAGIKGTGQWRQDADKILAITRLEDNTTRISQIKDRDPGETGSINLKWNRYTSNYEPILVPEGI